MKRKRDQARGPPPGTTVRDTAQRPGFQHKFPGFMEKPDDPLLYFGVADPVNMSDDADTLFLRPKDVEKLKDEIVGKPLYMDHLSKKEEAGRVVASTVDPETNKLWVWFLPNMEDNGILARRLLGEDTELFKDKPESMYMGQLSIGYNYVDYKDAQGRTLPRGDVTAQELSLCYAGSRPGTYIKGAMPISHFLKHTREMDGNNI